MTPTLSRSERVVILGAGPTGLGAATRLKELGFESFHVYDRANRVGGLAASFVDARGFTWDVGGHVQFSHYHYFDDLMDEILGTRRLEHERESWIWIEGRFVPYPFQNNIRYLTQESRWRCVKGVAELYKQPPRARPSHFREWIDVTFGAGIADVFLVPYNFKVWAHPLEELDYNWIGERVAVTDLTRLLDNIFHEKDDRSWGPNHTFSFPEHGGTGAIWEGVADRVGRAFITLEKDVKSIDPTSRTIVFHDGARDTYDVLVSTMPLDRLVDLAGLEELKPAASALKFSASHIVGVGLSGRPPETLAKKCWMYFPENDCPFYRVTVFSNYSPNNVPEPSSQWSLMAETAESSFKPVDASRIVAETIEGMRATRLVNESHQVLSTWHYRAPYGYPTPTLGRDAALNALQPALERHKIYSRGRFGGWKYEVSNQDHSLMQGVELVNRLALGVPEVTYPFPHVANDMKYAKRP